MADAKNPFELMIEQAQAMAKSMNPALENFSPKGFEAMWPTLPKEFMEVAFGKAFNKEGALELLQGSVSRPTPAITVCVA